MIILGVDLGFAHTGLAVVSNDYKEDNVEGVDVIYTQHIASCPQSGSIGYRLNAIAEAFEKLIKDYDINAIAYEKPFVPKSFQSGKGTIFIESVLLLTAYRYNIEITGYDNKKIKKCTVGNGSATKNDTRAWVKNTLGYDLPLKKQEHEADAVATAYTHYLHVYGKVS